MRPVTGRRTAKKDQASTPVYAQLAAEQRLRETAYRLEQARQDAERELAQLQRQPGGAV